MTIQTTDRDSNPLDIAAENRGGIEYPLNHILNAAGTKIDPATQQTLAALNVIAAAVQTAVESLNAKTTAVNTGAVTVANFPATQAISAASLPLPSDAATQATLANIDTDVGQLADAAATTDTGSFSLIALFKRALQNWTTLLGRVPVLGTSTPNSEASAAPTRIVGQDVWVCSFAGSGASVLSNDFITPVVGTGVTYNQTSGALNILTGTTANAEFLTRSTVSWRGAMRMRASIVASQRIANQNLQITLADLIGSTLAYTIVNATTVNVTLTAHGFTAQSVGQFMNLGGITGAAGIPGRYAIASIPDANTIQFTVAAWPASGSGTLTLFGYSYSRNLVTGVTATNIAWDCQRRGWASGDTTATINTTASPGTIIQNDLNGRDAFLMDALRATSTTPNVVTRASRYENLPDDTTPLFLWIWSYNGSTAPASTTTWTLGFVSVERFSNLPVYLQGARSNGASNAMPVQFPAAQAVTVSSGTITANQGTMAALPAGANAIGDVGVQYRANATGAASLVAVMSPATPAVGTIKGSAGRLVGWQMQNSSASLRSVKIFNATAPTLGTTAAVFEIDIPAGGRTDIENIGGVGFATAITWSVTSAKGLTDNTATGLAANDVSGAFFFA